MIGKIVPYVIVGSSRQELIIGIGVLLLGVPVVGSLFLLALLWTLFIAANLAVSYTFSTWCRTRYGDADVDDVFPAEHPLSGFHVSVCRGCRAGRNLSARRCR